MPRGSGSRCDDPVDGTLGELGMPSEQQATLQQFGHGMQGPSGVPIPEPMDERSKPSVANELTPGDGAGIVVPQDPLSVQAGTPGDQERAFAAVAAANRRGGGSESVLDALEAAESQSQAASAHSGEGASTASAEGQQEGISPGLRQEAQARLLQALQQNLHLQGADRGHQLQQWALTCEGTCLNKSQGNRVRYHNLIVNAARLAAYETDVGAIPAKAAGELVGEDWAAQAPQGGPGATKTGLQGMAAHDMDTT